MFDAFLAGLAALRRNWSLAVVVWVVNLSLAATFAVPLAVQLEHDLANSAAAAQMRDGFDFDWWQHWHEQRKDYARAFGPELTGAGFAWRNLDLLLRGHLPARLFDRGVDGAADALDPTLLALGVLALCVHAFLSGGLAATLRTPAGGFKLRGLLHACGFYFGRFARLTLLTLGLVALVFLLHAPLARWAEWRGLEAVSENTALAWAVAQRALLLAGLALVFLLSSYAKALIVLEERASALLALVSAAGFCLRRAGQVLGQALLMLLLGLLAFAAWRFCDARLQATGYASQIPVLLALQAFVFARIWLRLALLAGQIALLRDGGA
jgi:hypothetical protein